MTKSIVRLEPRRTALRQNDAGAWDPVGFLAVNQMPDDVERAECLGPLIGADPGVVEVLQERRQRRRRPSQNFGCPDEIEIHSCVSRRKGHARYGSASFGAARSAIAQR